MRLSRSTSDERITVVDDRLLHMTREEAVAYLDEYIQQRELVTVDDRDEQNGKR